MTTQNQAASETPIRYEVIDRQTRTVVAVFTDGAAAGRKVDALDRKHGASRYSRKAIWA